MKHIKLIRNVVLTAISFSIVQHAYSLELVKSTEIQKLVEPSEHYTQIYTSEGYPYDLLINRTDVIKLFYKDNEQQTRNSANMITCHVEITDNDKTWVGGEFQVKASSFKEKPIDACMDRNFAKEILKATF